MAELVGLAEAPEAFPFQAGELFHQVRRAEDVVTVQADDVFPPETVRPDVERITPL